MTNIRRTLAILGCILLVGLSQHSMAYRIGFSQVTTTEPWRVLFNKQLRAEAKKHPNIQLFIADGQDRTSKQVADVQSFIQQKVDVILLAPKGSAGLSAAVKEAMQAGIPVIVLDRKINGDHYSQFIGGNNLEIGRQAGRKALELLGIRDVKTIV